MKQYEAQKLNNFISPKGGTREKKFSAVEEDYEEEERVT
jgi:hypothetical protein